MTNTSSPAIGILEGFFGRSWTWEQRQRLIAFMSREQYDFYLYAPKSDPYLRSRWREDWPDSQWRALKNLRQAYRASGVAFGLGLSPLDLCTHLGKADTQALTDKINRIRQLEPDWLGLFFDDMRGDMPDLAARQAELAHLARDLIDTPNILLCPTYYSHDPVLDKVFGTRPENYLHQLGRQLDPNIHVFWTGPKVCSETYPNEHLEEVAQQLQRKPFLWDNYPVNDGAIKSKHLYLHPPETSRFSNKQHIAGIAANPMNEFALSLPALAALSQGVKTGSCKPLESQLNQLFPQPLAHYLREDAHFFAHEGLNGIDDRQRQHLLSRYQPHTSHEAAQEVVDWLNGEYAFDPACLTE